MVYLLIGLLAPVMVQILKNMFVFFYYTMLFHNFEIKLYTVEVIREHALGM